MKYIRNRNLSETGDEVELRDDKDKNELPDGNQSRLRWYCITLVYIYVYFGVMFIYYISISQFFQLEWNEEMYWSNKALRFIFHNPYEPDMRYLP